MFRFKPTNEKSAFIGFKSFDCEVPSFYLHQCHHLLINLSWKGASKLLNAISARSAVSFLQPILQLNKNSSRPSLLLRFLYCIYTCYRPLRGNVHFRIAPESTGLLTTRTIQGTPETAITSIRPACLVRLSRLVSIMNHYSFNNTFINMTLSNAPLIFMHNICKDSTNKVYDTSSRVSLMEERATSVIIGCQG